MLDTLLQLKLKKCADHLIFYVGQNTEVITIFSFMSQNSYNSVIKCYCNGKKN